MVEIENSFSGGIKIISVRGSRRNLVSYWGTNLIAALSWFLLYGTVAELCLSILRHSAGALLGIEH